MSLHGLARTDLTALRARLLIYRTVLSTWNSRRSLTYRAALPAWRSRRPLTYRTALPALHARLLIYRTPLPRRLRAHLPSGRPYLLTRGTFLISG